MAGFAQRFDSGSGSTRIRILILSGCRLAAVEIARAAQNALKPLQTSEMLTIHGVTGVLAKRTGVAKLHHAAAL